jgi:CRISPR-associated protein Cmr2
LSEALTNFALHFVPDIVEKKHHGTLIYAGGDDVLALLPTETALACAAELEEVWRRDWADDDRGTRRLLMGGRATVSAGVAVVHYKEDLRLALQAARDAEKQAKSAGRDALGLRVVRRSGEDSSAVVGWGQVGALQALVNDFRAGASDRWTYRLRAELPTLGALPEGAFRGETCRLLDRMEAPPDWQQAFRDRVLQFWDDYRGRRGDGPDTRADFVTLCQSASFLARGRDQQ